METKNTVSMMTKTIKLPNKETGYNWCMMTDDGDEQSNQLKQMMRRDLALVLAQTLSDRLHWRGTQTDLVVVCYAACSGAMMLDPESQPMKFTTVVNQVCTMLHTKRPTNPWACLAQARSRKNKYRLPLLERYRQMAFCQGVEHPVLADVRLS